ncbi:MAG: Transcriptional regulator LysR family [Puniceicoccaceae bacterium 5H]|nr:MAG: Transcriptional regulator LysR family [Puniceicoccaceae bacterium 5H]
MELHQIRYFVEVARVRNFTRAAERCHISQPTLSHQIRKLEEELGEPLFHRQRSGVRLTPFGDIFYPRATRILQEVKSVEDEALSFQQEVRGVLRIGVIPTIAPYLLPRLVEAMIEQHPGVTFEVSEDPTEILLQRLRHGQLDMALASPPLPDEQDWRLCDLLEDELLITLPRHHPLAGRQQLSLDELKQHPLVLMKEAHCLSQQSLSVCHRAGFQPNVKIESSQLETVLALVEVGLGLSFTPSIALPFMSPREVVFSSIAPQSVFRRISLIWPKSAAPTRAHLAFLELAQELFASMPKAKGEAVLPVETKGGTGS